MRIGTPHVSKQPARIFSGALVILVLVSSVICGEMTSAFGYDLGVIEPVVLKRDLSAWAVLDARPKKEWQTAHILTAMSFSWEDYTSIDEKKVPYRTWPAKALAAVLGKMGINENTPIVVYGDADTSWGGEGWVCWALAWLGHEGPIRLLVGGIQAWKNQSLPVTSESGDHAHSAVHYHPRVTPEINITTDQIKRDPSAYVLVDTRSTFEWIRGRLPGAIHICWKKFYSGKDRRPLSPDETRQLLSRHDIGSGKSVVYYCTGGIRSAYAWLIHMLAGLPLARNYEGGMEAWNRLDSHSDQVLR